MIKAKEVKDAFNEMMPNLVYNYEDTIFHWEGDTFTDGEVCYTVDKYPNGEFECVRVWLNGDGTWTYKEFYSYEYKDIYELIYAATSEKTLEEIINEIDFLISLGWKC